jgi:hypothetical protein
MIAKIAIIENRRALSVLNQLLAILAFMAIMAMSLTFPANLE